MPSKKCESISSEITPKSLERIADLEAKILACENLDTVEKDLICNLLENYCFTPKKKPGPPSPTYSRNRLLAKDYDNSLQQGDKGMALVKMLCSKYHLNEPSYGNTKTFFNALAKGRKSNAVFDTFFKRKAAVMKSRGQ